MKKTVIITTVLVSCFFITINAVFSASNKPNCDNFKNYVCNLCGQDSQACKNTIEKIKKENTPDAKCKAIHNAFKNKDQAKLKTYLCKK